MVVKPADLLNRLALCETAHGFVQVGAFVGVESNQEAPVVTVGAGRIPYIVDAPANAVDARVEAATLVASILLAAVTMPALADLVRLYSPYAKGTTTTPP